MSSQDALCSEEELQQLVAAIAEASDNQAALMQIDRLLAAHQVDARLWFLRGSLMVELKQPAEAAAAMRRATELAPEFHLALFQLGFLQLSMGDPEFAAETWAPLLKLAEQDPLRLFVEGLNHLAADRFEASRQKLEAGLEAGPTNAPLAGNIRLLLEHFPNGVTEPDAPASAAEWLLRSFSDNTRH